MPEAERTQKGQEREKPEPAFRDSVANVADYAVCLLDAAGVVRSWSDGAERLTGFGAEEIIGRPFSCLYRPEDRAAGRPERSLKKAAEHGHFEGEAWQVRKDGTQAFAELMLTPLRDAAGALSGFVHVTRDTTQVNRLEERFHQVEEARRDIDTRLQSILNSMEEVVWSSSLDRSHLFYIGPSAAEIYGRSPDEFIADPTLLLRVIHDDDQIVALKAAEKVHSRGEYDVEYRIARPDKSLRWLHDRGRVIKDERGRPIRIDGMVKDVTERKQAEQALHESQQRLELALKAADQGLWDWNILTGHLYVDERWAAFLGYRQEEIEPHVRSWERMIHPHDIAYVMDERGKHLDGKTPHYRTEHRVKTKAGKWKWVLDNGRVVERDAQGKPVRAVGTHHDITERKQAEIELSELNARLEERVRARTQQLADANQELRESSRRFRAIFNSTYQFIGLLSRDGVLLEINQSALEFIGIPGSAVLGRFFWDTPFWTHSPEAQQHLQQAIKTAGEGDFVRFETTHRSFDGRLAVVDFSVKPIMDENRTVVLLVVEGREITERKKAEEAVLRANTDLDRKVQERTGQLAEANAKLEREVSDRRAAEARLRQVVESAPSGMLLMHQSGIVQLINRKIEEQFGYARQELIGQQVELLIPHRYRSRHLTARARFFSEPATRPMGQGRELYGLRQDGSEFPIEIGLSPIETAEGLGVLASVTDITDRRRLQEQLRRTERIAELGTLASGMAHEIGTPMNVILGRAEYLLQRSSDETMKKGLATIVTQVERITKVMNQLLAFARRRSPERRRVDLAQTIAESLEMFRERLSRKGIVTETLYGESLPPVMADPDQMTQVLINLIMNSIHAMPAGGRLRVKASRADGRVAVEVSDSGHGIPRDVLGKIFDPFFTTKDTGEGTGLGLTVVKGIIEEHDGTIEVSSEVGKGTMVTLSLPIELKQAARSGE